MTKIERLLKKYFGAKVVRDESVIKALYNIVDGHIRTNPTDPVFKQEFSIAKRAYGKSV